LRRPLGDSPFFPQWRPRRTKHWDLPIRKIGDEHVAAWLKGGANRGTVDKLRLMFNDAASAPAGTLVDRNPFANLRLPGSRGRKDVQPPNEAEIARFVALADELTSTATWVGASFRQRCRRRS
jgi:hypothetical protein